MSNVEVTIVRNSVDVSRDGNTVTVTAVGTQGPEGSFSGTLSTDLIPDTASTRDLGSESVPFAEAHADRFFGEIEGATIFSAKNESGSTLLKGKAVYISGVSGNKPTVDLADANDSSKMPAFGLVYADANNNADVDIVTFGTLSGVDTSSFAEGTVLYVSKSAGLLTGTVPTGEASLIQNMGKVVRQHSSAGSIKVIGAGRTNATPNLDSGNIFVGNSSGQSTTEAFVDRLSPAQDLATRTDIAAGTVTGIIKMSQADYDDITTPVSTILYVIV